MSTASGLNSTALSTLDDSNSIEDITTLNRSAFTPYAYLGGRVGWTKFQDACVQEWDRCNNDTLSYGMYGGYKVLPWLAFEGGITDYGKPTSTHSYGDISAIVRGGEVSAKLSHRIIQEFDLFSRFGVSYQRIRKDLQPNHYPTLKDNNWNPIIAVGFEYFLSPSVSFRTEYQFLDGIGGLSVDHADMHFTSLGFSYHFGQSLPSINKQTDINPIFEEAKPNISVELRAEQLFTFDSNELHYSKELEALAIELTHNHSGFIYIVGHTDNIGTEKYNVQLSLLRAKSVASYLKRMGISESRFIIQGVGESKPVASNNTESGRKLNRRVEIKFHSMTSPELQE